MNLTEQLKKQMGFIRNSALLFDQGRIDEAVRLGVSMRVLLHDTTRSQSILALMKAKAKTNLLSTMPARLDGVRTFGFGITGLTMGKNFVQVKPNFKEHHTSHYICAHEWWLENVFAMPEIGAFSRADFALIAANKDGGAHVGKLPERFQRIKDGKTNIFATSGTAKADFSDVWPATLRQMAWEMENSPDLVALYS